MKSAAIPQPRLLGTRALVLIVLGVLGVLAYMRLGLEVGGLLPGTGGAGIAQRFFAAALTPAFDYQGHFTPVGAPPFLFNIGVALWKTLIFAVAAMSISVPAGLFLGYLAAATTWEGDPTATSRTSARLGLLAYGSTRLLIACMRSVHELLWAVIFLVTMGLTTASAVVAIAIPFTGTLAKVFSEMLDEAPRHTAAAVRATGATPPVIFLCGRLPRALPDIAAYSFYRFECAVRSSAILGFFGLPTLGFFIKASFENLHYNEVWSYLYALLAAVLLLEGWSSLLRRRFVT
ncbi:MAG: phosphonate transport system permease protein [Planctomycetota bacterium]|jgi:phosphonate transport system permease protein